MAITDVRLISFTGGGTQQADSRKLKVLVKTNAVNTTSAAVLLAALAAFPAPAGYMIATHQEAKRKHPFWWDVDIEFQTPSFQFTDTDPLLRESILSSSYDEFTEQYFKDVIDGSMVLNSAGERFESFPLRRNGKLILQVVKNFADAPLVAYDEIKFTTNASAITIKGITFEADTLLLLPVTTTQMTEMINGIKNTYISTMLRVATDHKLHDDYLLDVGYKYLDGGTLKDIGESLNPKQTLTSPWPLDGSGGKKSSASDEPSTIQKSPYDSVEWGLDFN